jgi:hypothetical protein
VTGVNTERFEALKGESKHRSDTKEERRLISPSVFDPELSTEFDRGLDNVVYANGVWLDFEHGDLSHKDFATIFPCLRVVAFNSFSSTKARPRFRIYIPTTRKMTADEYEFITSQIVQVVHDNGFVLKKHDLTKPLKAHGIGMGKLHAASLFYVPCQPKDPKGRIWKDHKGGGRAPLNPDEWLENAIAVEGDWPDTRPRRVTELAEGWDQNRANAAMARWYQIRTHAGNGDNELFRVDLELKAANAPYYERERMLTEAAKSATTPGDRTRQVKRLLRRR